MILPYDCWDSFEKFKESLPTNYEFYNIYHISSNKHWATNKRCPLISTAPLTINIEINASL